MSAAAAMDSQQQPPHSLAMLHTSPTGQPFIGHPPAPSPASDPNRAARVPLDKVQTGEGVTQSSQDRRTLWLECQSAGFKVECEIKPEDEEQQADKKELVLRDSSKNVQSVVVEVDQSPESPSALVVLTLAPSAGASSPRYYHFHLALSHPSYSHLDVEKLKHILRGWQQSSNRSLKAVIAPQLALSPTDPRPPAKPEDYNPSDSTTWVAPFPVQVPPAPPAPATPAAAPNSSGLTSLADLDADGDVDAPGEADIDVDAAPTGEGSSSGKKRRSSLSQAGSPEAHEDALLRQNAAGDDPLFWNDTGRARRRSTLKVKSYVEGGGEAPMNLDGTGERARTSKSPPKNPSAPSYPYPSSAAPALSSNKRTLDADVTAAKKRRRSPSASAPSPRSSASAALPNVGGHFTRGASAAAQQQQQLQQQQQQQQQVDLALVGNLPPLPEGLAAHVANAPGGVARPIAPRPGPSTPSSSSAAAFATGAGPSSALGHPTTPAYSPYTPAAVPGSAPPGGVAPTPLSVYSQLHDLYAYVAQLAPMVTESKGTIKRLEMEGVEREREVRRLREEVLLLRQTGSPRGSQASLGDVGEVVSTGEGQVEGASAASSATLSVVGGAVAGAGAGEGEGEKAVVEPAKAVEAEEVPAVQEGEKAVADAEKVVEEDRKEVELPVSEADAAVPEGL